MEGNRIEYELIILYLYFDGLEIFGLIHGWGSRKKEKGLKDFYGATFCK